MTQLRNTIIEARLQKAEARLRKAKAKSDTESRCQEALRKSEAEKGELRKAEAEEALRKAEAEKEAYRQANQIRMAAARRQANGALIARFSSLEELCADLAKCGRDAFVANLAKNHSAHDTSRPRYKIDKDGIIYALICRVNMKVYVGQTNNYDFRMRAHFSWVGGAPYIKKAINEHGWKIFVSVILLAGIEQEELDSAEIAMMQYLDCLLGTGDTTRVGEDTTGEDTARVGNGAERSVEGEVCRNGN
jgi:hypothetical protein